MKILQFIKKNKTILLLIVCLAAIGEGVYSGFGNTDSKGIRNKYTNFVMSQYGKLDDGIYDELSQAVIEGSWDKEDGEYVLSGIMEMEEIERIVMDDLGVNGWRIRFVILKPQDFYILGRDEFAKTFERESSILEYIDSAGEIEKIQIVELTGHVTGRCSIIDWVRTIPVVKIDGRLKMIIRGMPKVYYLIHKEQWFKPVKF